MPRPSYSLTYNGVNQLLADWGLGPHMRRTLLVGASDIVVFSQLTGSFFDDDTFTPGSYVSLFRDAVRIFHGRVRSGARAYGTTAGRTYEVRGAWEEFERRVYCQPWQQRAGGVVTSQVDYGRAFLFSETGAWPNNGAITTGLQIRGAVQFAIDHGAPVQIGYIDAGVTAPPLAVQDLTVAEVIRRCMIWTPGAACWFDYATTPPTFHFREHGNLPYVVTSITLFAAQPGLSIQPTFVREVTGLVINAREQIPLELTEEEEAAADENTPRFETRIHTVAEPSNARAGDDGVIVWSVELEEMPGDRLAVAIAYLAQLASLGWAGSGAIRDQDVRETPTLGNRLRINDGRAEWATMDAVIHRVDDDFRTGTRRISFGPLPWLSLDELSGLLGANRRRATLSDGEQEERDTGQQPEQTVGFDPKKKKQRTEEGGGGGEGETFATVQTVLAADGTPTARVLSISGTDRGLYAG